MAKTIKEKLLASSAKDVRLAVKEVKKTVIFGVLCGIPFLDILLWEMTLECGEVLCKIFLALPPL